jgi:hypothetical protein
MTKSSQLDRDLIEHARQKLQEAARSHVRGGMGPASAAYAAIRETKALFPPDWKLGVQGDDDEESVEVWEVEHKQGSAIATVHATAPEPPPKLTESQSNLLSHIIGRPKDRTELSATQQRSLAKLIKLRLVTKDLDDRYRATEAGFQAYYGGGRG